MHESEFFANKRVKLNDAAGMMVMPSLDANNQISLCIGNGSVDGAWRSLEAIWWNRCNARQHFECDSITWVRTKVI